MGVMQSRISTTSLALLVLFGLSCGIARAGGPTPVAETPSQAVAQTDGITNRVVDGLWRTTDTYWHQGDYNRVVALLRVCVEADPSFTEAYSVGAWLIWSMGDTANADQFLQYGLARTGDPTSLEYEYGWHLFNTKRYEAALPHLKNAVDKGDTDRVALTTLAHCYRLMGRYDHSITTWQLVIARFPDFRAAKTNLAKVIDLKNLKTGKDPVGPVGTHASKP